MEAYAFKPSLFSGSSGLFSPLLGVFVWLYLGSKDGLKHQEELQLQGTVEIQGAIS